MTVSKFKAIGELLWESESEPNQGVGSSNLPESANLPESKPSEPSLSDKAP